MLKSAKSKSAKKRAIALPAASVSDAKPTPQTATNPKGKKSGASSKQSRVIAMLRSPTGATIASMMKATGWQQHSVRGFLAGVVRKRLKLKFTSKKVEGNRIYRIASGGSGKSSARDAKGPAA